MRRGLMFLCAAVFAAACSLPSVNGPPPDQVSADVPLTVDVVAQTWVGHSSAAVFSFAADGTFTADGVPTAVFDTASPFAKAAPHGPYTCSGTWALGTDPTELTVRFERIADPRGLQPLPGRHELTYHGVYDGRYPQFRVLLFRYEDWLAPQ